MPLLLERSATLLKDLRVAALAEREILKPKHGRKYLCELNLQVHLVKTRFLN